MPAQSVPQPVRDAMAIAAAIYPELASRQQHVVVNDGAQVRLDFQEAVTLGIGPQPPIAAPTLSTVIAFDERGEWLSLDSYGSHVRSDDYIALQRQVKTRPFQSAAEAQGWLRGRQAQYGPDRAPAMIDPANSGWRHAVKAEVTVQAGGFQWVDAATGNPHPGWVMYLSHTAGAQGRRSTYQVLLEPFGGRVVRVIREGR
jgi:hypothetical protein